MSAQIAAPTDAPAEFAASFVQIERDVREARDWLDNVRGMFRALLTAHGKKSMAFATDVGDVTVRLVPKHTFWCACCSKDASLCADAVAGNVVRLRRVDLEPYVSIKLAKEST